MCPPSPSADISTRPFSMASVNEMFFAFRKNEERRNERKKKEKEEEKEEILNLVVFNGSNI